jgi:1-acyl-sn-glycerol-3-phosphate acyltransferase
MELLFDKGFRRNTARTTAIQTLSTAFCRERGGIPSTMLTAVFSVCYWLFLVTTSILLYPVAVLLCLATAPFDADRTLLHRYTCWWARLYLRCLPGCRLQVEGRDKITPRIPFVMVANHQSMTDIMALSALAVPFKWVSKKEAFRLPCIGWNMYLNQYVRVDRGNLGKVRETMERCRHWLRRGVPVLIFPEGHRSRSGEMIPFHGGAFKLAVDSGCAVVPIVVEGTLPIYRGWKVLACPGWITIRILDPIARGEGDESAERLRQRVFQRMKETLAEMRGQQTPSEPVPQVGPQA